MLDPFTEASERLARLTEAMERTRTTLADVQGRIANASSLFAALRDAPQVRSSLAKNRKRARKMEERLKAGLQHFADFDKLVVSLSAGIDISVADALAICERAATSALAVVELIDELAAKYAATPAGKT